MATSATSPASTIDVVAIATLCLAAACVSIPSDPAPRQEMISSFGRLAISARPTSAFPVVAMPRIWSRFALARFPVVLDDVVQHEPFAQHLRRQLRQRANLQHVDRVVHGITDL